MKPRKKRPAMKRHTQPQRKNGRTRRRHRPPINLVNAKRVPEFSGFLIIRLLPKVVSYGAHSLDDASEKFNLHRLATLLKRYDCPSQPLIHLGCGR